MNFIQNLSGLILIAVLQNPLDNSAAIGMGRQLVDLTGKRVDNEIEMLWWNTLDHFLHDVVTILIFYALKNYKKKKLAGLLP